MTDFEADGGTQTETSGGFAPHVPEVERRSILSGQLCGALFALFGFIISLRAFAESVIPQVVVPANSLVFREIQEGRPISRLLDWYNTRIPLLADIRDLHPAFVISIGLVLLLSLCLLGIAILNPTFQPVSRSISVTGSATEEAVGENIKSRLRHRAQTLIHIDPVHLEQALRLLCIGALPVAAVWVLTGAFNLPATIMPGLTEGANLRREVLRFAVLGIGMFVTFCPNGIAGRFGILSQAYATDDKAAPGRQLLTAGGVLRVAGMGLLFGLATCAVQHQALGVPTDTLFLIFHRLGTFNSAHLNTIAGPFFASVVVSWFSIGLLLFGFGRPGLSLAHRAVVLVPALALIALLPGIRRPLAAETITRRYDASAKVLTAAPSEDPHRPVPLSPSGKEAGEALAALTGLDTIDSRKPQTRDVMVFHPNGGFQVEMTDVTDDGIIADPAKASRILEFLKKRDYQTVLSWSAIKTLFNSANVQFDTTGAIKAGLLDMEHTPHMANIGDTVRNLFTVCSASPQNLALLREYADDKNFVLDNRNTYRLLGTLFRRFGEVKDADKWYRLADMPQSFMQRFHAEKPLFHTGKVRGKLLFNGIPLKGVQVGLAPRRLNGLPRDMEPQLLAYDRELISADPDISPYYSLYHPRPFHFRWIVGGTTTGPDGSFEVKDITEGEYYLVCTLPSGIKLELPVDRDLRVQNAPHAFTLSYASPDIDLGAIAFTKSLPPQSDSILRSH